MRWNFRELGWRLLPGSLAALAIAGFGQLGGFNPLEWMAYQAFVRLKGIAPINDQIVIVAIDEPSLKQLGRFPWPRRYYTQLLKQLAQAEASVVAFDMLWSESSPEDEELAQAISQHGQVVLAQAWEQSGLPLRPVPTLESRALATGHIVHYKDGDGLTRKVFLELQGEMSFAAAIVQAYSLVQTAVSLPDLTQPLWINWSDYHFKEYSFVQVLKGQIPPEYLRHKIVLIGVAAAGLDPLDTPFRRNPPSHGIHLQATVINNLLRQNWLQPLAPFWLGVVLLVAGPGASLLFGWVSGRMQWVIGLGGCLLWGGLCLGLLQLRILAPVVLPMSLLLTTTVSVSILERLRLNALLQQQIQRLWQTHYQDLVIHPAAPFFLQSILIPTPSASPTIQQLGDLAALFARSQSTQSAIARSLSIGLVAADLDGFIWFCNPVAAGWLGVQVGEQLTPQRLPQWLTEAQWQNGLQSLRSQQTSEVWEVQNAERWFELKIEPLLYQQREFELWKLSGQVAGLLWVIEESTERKQAEIAQVQLNQSLSERTLELETVNQELETFSYAVSHDLRSPLGRIRGFSEALLEDCLEQLDALGQDYLRRIQSSAERMEELVEDLLKLSQINRYEMYRETVDLSALVNEILEVLQQQHPDRGVDLQIQSEVLAEADARLLKIALENLLNNAWKFTNKREKTQIRFGLAPDQVFSAVESMNPQTPIYFIQDNGIGFEHSESHQLFGAFRRLSNAKSFVGTGIGLTTVQRIIHRHSGTIWAEGKLNQGAIFYFTLA